MAAAESKLKQRIVGAIVLVALAVIFLPMLFKKEDAAREVVVRVPPTPEAPVVQQYPVTPVAVPELELDDSWDELLMTDAPVETESVTNTASPDHAAMIDAPPIVSQQPQPVLQQPAVQQPVAQQPVAPGIDKNNLPVSWSVQLANLTSQENAYALRDTYRNKQYNAYVRSANGTHRVMIGPLIRQTDAQAMCKRLKSREGQDCFVVRYEP